MTETDHNPYDPPQTRPQNTISGWKTWSPFQSDNVRQICAHMTAAEISAANRRGLIYGLWVAVSVALPLQYIFIGFATAHFNPILATVCGLLVVAHIAGIPIWQRRQRQFLCSTIWASERSIQPDSLKLFSFRE